MEKDEEEKMIKNMMIFKKYDRQMRKYFYDLDEKEKR